MRIVQDIDKIEKRSCLYHYIPALILDMTLKIF